MSADERNRAVSKPARRGRLVVVSAPSGAGKSSVCNALVARNADVAVSISYTTRPARGSERDGVEYHFVEDTRFDAMIAAGQFLEWADVHDRRYGTARADVGALLVAGKDVLFDIDVQGGMQIQRAAPDSALLVFVLPPSVEELVRRLTGRGTESADQIASRLHTAIWELEQGLAYDCHLVNDRLDEAVEELDRLRTTSLEEARRVRLDERLVQLLADSRSILGKTI